MFVFYPSAACVGGYPSNFMHGPNFRRTIGLQNNEDFVALDILMCMVL